MRILSLLPVCLCLVSVSACDTPQVGFNYERVEQLNVGGNDYKVFYTSTKAQAVRLNNVGLRQRQAAVDFGVDAIALATECAVKKVDPKSDPSLIIARIKC